MVIWDLFNLNDNVISDHVKQFYVSSCDFNRQKQATAFNRLISYFVTLLFGWTDSLCCPNLISNESYIIIKSYFSKPLIVFFFLF
jgi:hypothetical protein